MDRKMIEEIYRKLQVFGFGKLQELVTLFEILKREGIPPEKVKDYIASVLENQQQQQVVLKARAEAAKRQWNENTRRCPTCTKPLVVRAITLEKGKSNLKGYTCHWYCQEESCDFEEYTHESYQKVYEKIMGGR